MITIKFYNGAYEETTKQVPIDSDRFAVGFFKF